jgi:hypothetical protein
VCRTIRSADVRVSGDSVPARHTPPLSRQSLRTHSGMSCKPRHVAVLMSRVAFVCIEHRRNATTDTIEMFNSSITIVKFQHSSFHFLHSQKFLLFCLFVCFFDFRHERSTMKRAARRLETDSHADSQIVDCRIGEGAIRLVIDLAGPLVVATLNKRCAAIFRRAFSRSLTDSELDEVAEHVMQFIFARLPEEAADPWRILDIEVGGELGPHFELEAYAKEQTHARRYKWDAVREFCSPYSGCRN